MQYSTRDVQAIYDKAYANRGLMGTQLDLEYSRFTKVTLLEMCENAPNPRILDLGTGDGDLWQFASCSLEWYAVDISHIGTRHAVERFPQLNAAVSTAEYLPYPDRFFGTVIAADTIEHVFDVQSSLAEVRRVLAPGGKFALSVPAPNSLRKWAYNRFLRQVPSLSMFARLLWIVGQRQFLFGKAAFQPIDRDFSIDEWRTELNVQGFEIVEIMEWPQSPLEPIVFLLGAQCKEV